AASRQRRRLATCLVQLVAVVGQSGLDGKGGRFEVVRAGGDGAAQGVPCLVHGRGRHAERRREEGVGALLERERLDTVAGAGGGGPPAADAEGDVGAERAGEGEVVA